MSQKNIILNANPIVTFLQKPAASFTKADIINYIVSNEIRMVNFMYPGGDGKLKTLNFVINDLDYTRLQRFLLLRCSVLISTRMVIPWSLRQSTRSIRQL